MTTSEQARARALAQDPALLAKAAQVADTVAREAGFEGRVTIPIREVREALVATVIAIAAAATVATGQADDRLLAKYMRYLREVEGADFVTRSDRRNSADEVQFTEDEWALLTRLGQDQ